MSNVVKIFNKSKNSLPEYASKLAAGLDLKADLFDKKISDFIGEGFTYEDNKITLSPQGRVLISTGLYFAIPDGYEIQVRPRSGLALKYGISVLNSPGTIDADFRGLCGVILINTGIKNFDINDGDRIAQAVLNKVEQIEWYQVDDVQKLGDTERGTGGFGHTGK